MRPSQPNGLVGVQTAQEAVEESGGKVTHVDGSKFEVVESRDVLASNGLIHQQLLDEMQAIMHGRDLEELPSPLPQ